MLSRVNTWFLGVPILTPVTNPILLEIAENLEQALRKHHP